jgi:hypothetical protein
MKIAPAAARALGKALLVMAGLVPAIHVETLL